MRRLVFGSPSASLESINRDRQLDEHSRPAPLVRAPNEIPMLGERGRVGCAHADPRWDRRDPEGLGAVVRVARAGRLRPSRALPWEVGVVWSLGGLIRCGGSLFICRLVGLRAPSRVRYRLGRRPPSPPGRPLSAVVSDCRVAVRRGTAWPGWSSVGVGAFGSRARCRERSALAWDDGGLIRCWGSAVRLPSRRPSGPFGGRDAQIGRRPV
jgi:hypothetical protein